MKIRLFHKILNIEFNTDFNRLPKGTLVRCNKGLFPFISKDKYGIHIKDHGGITLDKNTKTTGITIYKESNVSIPILSILKVIFKMKG